MIAVGGSFNRYRAIKAYKFLTRFFLVVGDFYKMRTRFGTRKRYRSEISLLPCYVLRM